MPRISEIDELIDLKLANCRFLYIIHYIYTGISSVIYYVYANSLITICIYCFRKCVIKWPVRDFCSSITPIIKCNDIWANKSPNQIVCGWHWHASHIDQHYLLPCYVQSSIQGIDSGGSLGNCNRLDIHTCANGSNVKCTIITDEKRDFAIKFSYIQSVLCGQLTRKHHSQISWQNSRQKLVDGQQYYAQTEPMATNTLYCLRQRQLG